VDDDGFVFKRTRRSGAGAAAAAAAAAAPASAQHRDGSLDAARPSHPPRQPGGNSAADLVEAIHEDDITDVPAPYHGVMRALAQVMAGNHSQPTRGRKSRQGQKMQVAELCRLLSENVQVQIQQYQSQLPTPHYHGVVMAYKAVLGAWVAHVTSMCQEGLIIAPGDIEAAAGVVQLDTMDSQGSHAVLLSLKHKLQREEVEWAQLASQAVRDQKAMEAEEDKEVEEKPLKAELQQLVDDSAKAAREGSMLGILEDKIERVHRRLTLQIDALTALVTGAEDLAVRAERACQSMQSELRTQAFSHLLHVDSPLALIRGLTRQPPATAGPAAAAKTK